MAINIKSLKFDADEKLLAYVNKKVEKLEKFFDNMGNIDVTLSLLPDTPENKAVQVKTHLPGEDLIIERNAKTFEEAVTGAADAMKEKIVRFKEKKFDK
ncbi:MAG: ribosome-associated translation inhibitor RaiA [Bacteroidota bacterium]|nr:ribosome-associated translation inhibitor RaiA [Bacteroidota bacterium]